MASRDIMPFKSVHGGTTQVKWASLDASEVFDIGEPVMVMATGELAEPDTDDDAWKDAEMGTGNRGC